MRRASSLVAQYLPVAAAAGNQAFTTQASKGTLHTQAIIFRVGERQPFLRSCWYYL